MNISYKTRLFLYFFAVFAAFTSIVIVYQQSREKGYKRHLIEEKLDIYCKLIENDVSDEFLPEEIRVTIMDNGGKVLYDNSIGSSLRIENHFDRPEIRQASERGYGSDIRMSVSVGQPFVYYAEKTSNGYIRAALPYNYEIENSLKAERSFLILALSLFIVALFFLWLIANKFGDDVMKLKADVIDQQKARLALKTEMTNAIAHELRTPVSAIRGYTETLSDADITPEIRNAFIQRTYNAAVRLSELLRDIGLLSKLEESDHLFEQEDVRVKEVVAEIVEEFFIEAKNNSITIENDIPADIHVYGNRLLLYSIFRNLVENSIKYAGKWVVVKVEMTGKDSQFYHFSVSDTGQGVNEKYVDRIFERFFRVNDGRSREDGGSGLGLSIVRHAVMFHGGEIVAINRPSGGLEVKFTIANRG